VSRDDDMIAENLIGHYAGAFTRLVAFLLDLAISIGVFNIVVAAGIWVINLFTEAQISTSKGTLWWFVPLGAWLFVYFWYCFSLAGKTPGMALFGIRVVRGDGSDLGGGRAAVRVLVLPITVSFIILGSIGVVFGKYRRAWHDIVADTVVVYDFDARAARLRFLTRRPIASAEQ
jgi:uncharacterized RDD family membrane protein YckC